MPTKELISQALAEVFIGENWTDVNVQQVLEGVSFDMAQEQVPFTTNTIAKILYHLKYSNFIIIGRAEGNPLQYDNENKGLAAPLLHSDAEWQNLIKETFASARILSETVRNFYEKKLFEPIVEGFSSAYRTFQGTAEHAYYHLGQMMMIKNI